MAVMFGAFQNNFAAAETKANVGFEITNVIISNGKCDFEGFFYNDGDADVRINAMQFVGTIKDGKGNVMYNIDFKIDESVADMSQCIVPAHGQYKASFTLTDSSVVAYNGEINADLDYKVAFE